MEGPGTTEFLALVYEQLLTLAFRDSEAQQNAIDFPLPKRRVYHRMCPVNIDTRTLKVLPRDNGRTLYLHNHMPYSTYLRLDYHAKSARARKLAADTGKTVIL